MTPKNHRHMNTVLITICFATVMLSIYLTQHNMHDCEARLYEKITGEKAPKSWIENQ